MKDVTLTELTLTGAGVTFRLSSGSISASCNIHTICPDKLYIKDYYFLNKVVNNDIRGGHWRCKGEDYLISDVLMHNFIKQLNEWCELNNLTLWSY